MYFCPVNSGIFNYKNHQIYERYYPYTLNRMQVNPIKSEKETNTDKIVASS